MFLDTKETVTLLSRINMLFFGWIVERGLITKGKNVKLELSKDLQEYARAPNDQIAQSIWFIMSIMIYQLLV